MKLDTIGKNIRHYRIAKKLRQEDLAEKTNLSPNYIGMLERGEKIPSLEALINILNALDITADMVLCDILKSGYTVKSSVLSEQLEKISAPDRERIYAVTEALIRHSTRIKP